MEIIEMIAALLITSLDAKSSQECMLKYGTVYNCLCLTIRSPKCYKEGCQSSTLSKSTYLLCLQYDLQDQNRHKEACQNTALTTGRYLLGLQYDHQYQNHNKEACQNTTLITCRLPTKKLHELAGVNLCIFPPNLECENYIYLQKYNLYILLMMQTI